MVRLLLIVLGLGIIVVFLRLLTVPQSPGLLLSMAWLGQEYALGLEYAARGLTALGIKSPTLAWVVLGVLLGGIAGGAHGYRVTERPRQATQVVALGIWLIVLLMLSAATTPALTTPH